MYIDSIFWFLSWPILIIISYQVSKMLIKRYESGEGKALKESEKSTK